MKLSLKEREFHRKVAVACFNGAWDLLDKKNRTADEDLRLLDLAHASLYHWCQIGTPENRAVGEWQVSRVYAELGQPQLALKLARKCLATCRDNRLSGIVHTANEALARAYAVSGNKRRAKKHLDLARAQLDKLTLDREDRAVYLRQIKETEALAKPRG